MAHSEVRVQNNAIDAIVATAQQILIESAQPVPHGGQVTGILPPASNCPAGATFSQPGPRKSVVPSHVDQAEFGTPGSKKPRSVPGLSLIMAKPAPGSGTTQRLQKLNICVEVMASHGV